MQGAGYVLLRLPLEVRDLFREWLKANFPDRVEHVFKLIRDMRGGKDYDSTWGKRMNGTGPYAWMIGRRFEIACEKLGLNKTQAARSRPSISSRRMPRAQQLSLFAVMSEPAAMHHAGDAWRARSAREHCAFYEALGFKRKVRATGDEVAFFEAGGVVLASVAIA